MPTGTVTFLDGTTNLGTAHLNASGAATLSMASLAVGTHPIYRFLRGRQQGRELSLASGRCRGFAKPGIHRNDDHTFCFRDADNNRTECDVHGECIAAGR